ncbi:MAG: hypothetical protein J6K97_03085 [Clostridia bacterium]|nr:hypothetical protein [Clostridia bacterium]
MFGCSKEDSVRTFSTPYEHQGIILEYHSSELIRSESRMDVYIKITNKTDEDIRVSVPSFTVGVVKNKGEKIYFSGDGDLSYITTEFAPINLGAGKSLVKYFSVDLYCRARSGVYTYAPLYQELVNANTVYNITCVGKELAHFKPVIM